MLRHKKNDIYETLRLINAIFLLFYFVSTIFAYDNFIIRFVSSLISTICFIITAIMKFLNGESFRFEVAAIMVCTMCCIITFF